MLVKNLTLRTRGSGATMSRIASSEGTMSCWLHRQQAMDMMDSNPRLLLDVPPHEVRTRIAHFVSRGSQTDSLLALAYTNRTQRAAVLDSLHRSCVMPPVCEPERLTRWVHVFIDDIRELICDRGTLKFITPGLQTYAVALCQASTLRRISMGSPDTQTLDAIRDSPSIREVKIRVDATTCLEQLWETLETLDLRVLELICSSSGRDCRLMNIVMIWMNENRSTSSWPNLRGLHLFCEDHEALITTKTELRDLLMGVLIPRHKRLESVTLLQLPSDEALPLLNGMQQVCLREACDSTYSPKFPMRLPQCLTALHTNGIFTEVHRSNLAHCVRLKELVTSVCSGSEIALGQALSKLKELRDLTVRWTHPARPPGYSLARLRAERLKFVQTPNLPALIVGHVPRVEKLRLYFVRIPVEDLMSILTSIGAGLKELELPGIQQYGRPCDWFVRVIELVMRHCPSLEVLSFKPYLSVATTEEADKILAEGADAGLRKLLSYADLLVSTMHVRVPLLDLTEIEDKFDWFRQFLPRRRRRLWEVTQRNC